MHIPRVSRIISRSLLAAIAGLLLFAPEAALAQGAAKLSGGNTAWIITATALVLFMTMPGLALFYGGLVRSKNVLSVLMNCFTIACVSSLLWLVLAYSIAFGGDGTWWGGLGKGFLATVGFDTLAGDIPESVFFMFQMTFAIITPALIVGAYVERIKFSAVVVFSGLWLIVVYAPSTHWIWGGGLLADLGWAGLKGYATMDFAGGLVVHANAGIAALIIAKVLGPRGGFPNELRPPHNPGMVMIGAAMLWVGWYGFNAGSALAANGSAGMAMTVTHISASTACLTWIAIEWIKFGKPSLVGIATGAIAGLATITPGSGFVGPVGALVFGFLAGIICYFSINIVKKTWNIDDSLDVFAVHGVGGVLGILLTGIFADASLGGVGLPEGYTIGTALLGQAIAAAVTVVWAVVAGYIVIKITQAVVGLRVDDDGESEGLDLSEHGERGYDL
ncbi:MAG: ammonium transporter [Rhodospirillales bacterium]|nr:ammonia channel protein [Rhodospirillaceae bacterium]MDP6428378.1 ammonium transporter [Rhodospirillales bacterium]MDP6642858.1 ammonium transporter [Rhodospirillales bacterium]MDP6842989.1 ammonium transporter [Rhodospirillales bacterium]